MIKWFTNSAVIIVWLLHGPKGWYNESQPLIHRLAELCSLSKLFEFPHILKLLNQGSNNFNSLLTPIKDPKVQKNVALLVFTV